MSGIKTNEEVKREKAILNTTIDKETFENFKVTCRGQGMRMSTLLETFMEQYTKGEFKLKFTNNSRELELKE